MSGASIEMYGTMQKQYLKVGLSIPPADGKI